MLFHVYLVVWYYLTSWPANVGHINSAGIFTAVIVDNVHVLFVL